MQNETILTSYSDFRNQILKDHQILRDFFFRIIKFKMSMALVYIQIKLEIKNRVT
jgi:hypothetical protein